MGKVPHVAAVRWICRVEFCWGCVCFIFTGVFTDSDAERMGSRCKAGTEKVPTKIEPQGCQSEPRYVPKHPLVNRVEKVKEQSGRRIYPLMPLSIKIYQKQIPNTIITTITQNIEIYPKWGTKKEANDDAKTHQNQCQNMQLNKSCNSSKLHIF